MRIIALARYGEVKDFGLLLHVLLKLEFRVTIFTAITRHIGHHSLAVSVKFFSKVFALKEIQKKKCIAGAF